MKGYGILEIETDESGEYCGDTCPSIMMKTCPFGAPTWDASCNPGKYKRLDACRAAARAYLAIAKAAGKEREA
jgi:hypothetical protein